MAGRGVQLTAARIVRLGTVESTQTVAFDLAAQGAADGTVVVADHQTAGRGRRGRHWHDEPGASLLMSIIVRSPLPVARRPLLSFAAAIAVADALSQVAEVEMRVKWPNDVLVRERKIAGILLESRTAAQRASDTAAKDATRADIAPTVIGIGINAGQSRFPPELAGAATSLALETGRTISREAMLGAVLSHFDRWREQLEREGFESVRARWLALSDTIGHEVTAEGHTGVAVGVDDDGALVLRCVDGLRRVMAGVIARTGGRRD